MTLLAVLAAFVLLGVNAFFVAYEFALVGSRSTKLESLAEDGSRRAKRGLEAIHDLNHQLGGAQLGITMASLGLGAVAEPALARVLVDIFGFTGLSDALLHTIAFVIALTIVVFLHMVAGEMVPKNITLVEPERALLALVSINRIYLVIFGPIIKVLTVSANLGMRLVGVEPKDEIGAAHTAAELAVMVATSRDEGAIEPFAAGLMEGVLDFGAREVGQVMVARDEIGFIRADTTVSQAEALVLDRGHSRLPVVGRDLDDVLGFVHAKDLLTVPPEEADGRLAATLVRRMLVVPISRSLEDLLLAMRRARVHFALVVDSEGRTAGLVTLEDLLEELVGDILDESDRGDRP